MLSIVGFVAGFIAGAFTWNPVIGRAVCVAVGAALGTGSAAYIIFMSL